MVKKKEEASRSPHPACAEEEQRGSVTHGGQYGGKNTDGWMDGCMGSRNMSHYNAVNVLIQYFRSSGRGLLFIPASSLKRTELHY